MRSIISLLSSGLFKTDLLTVIASTLAGQDETEEAVAARPRAAEEDDRPRPVLRDL